MAAAMAFAQPKGGGGGKGKGFSLPPSIKISVEGATDMGQFPAANAGGQGKSPKISWTQAPAATAAFVLLFHDPDPVLGGGTGDVMHWLVYNIPGDATELPAALPQGAMANGAVQASMGGAGYMGPQPPAGHGPHHYTIEMWALNAKLDVPAGATRDQVMAAMNGKVIGKGVFVTTFENK
jgi:Raf kinase inhibitor-like YbhB/YbcL family protein